MPDRSRAHIKSGTRALGVAESFRDETSTICAAVVTPQGRADGFEFASCTVGGLDATDSVIRLWQELDREDVRYCLISGVAPAWFNLLELDRLDRELPVPVFAITYEESDGLEGAITGQFDGEAAERRLERYRSLPPRERIDVDAGHVYVRSLSEGSDPHRVIRAYTQTGLRPEPIRIARLAARAADRWDRSR